MVLNILILLVGFAALVKGADVFVDGSASLARLFKVSGLIIGLTIVALGTSAPELAVSTTAALSGSNEIALSNVIGSNVFNLLMVLGICAILCSCCFYPVAFLLALVGLILGAVAIKKGPAGKGMAITGLILSIISVAIAALILIFAASLGISSGISDIF